MSSPATLSIDRIIDVHTYISPLAAPRRGFNEHCIIGSTSHIPIATRIKQYGTDFASDMVSDGFATTDPEYLAAQLYFSQSPQPDRLWVGRRDASALRTVELNAAGLGYDAGDELTIAGGTGGTFIVDTVDTGESAGAILTGHLGNQGTGYGLATGAGLSGGEGSGATVNITAIGETAVQAAQACRAANFEWYSLQVLGAAKAEHLLLAAWAEAASPDSVYAYTTQDADVITNATTDVMSLLKALSYSRSVGQWTNEATGNAAAIAAIMGYAMGQNTGLANTAFTLMFKAEIGIQTEPLDGTVVGYVEGKNGNLYLSYGNYYNIFGKGVMANGQDFSEILNLDMLKNDLQLNLMDLLYGTPKIPQTDAGQAQLIEACNRACEDAVLRGFLAPGKWTGPSIINLKHGDYLPKGYLCQSYPYSTQSDADRAAYKAMPIYIAIKAAGVVKSISIGVYFNR